MEGGYILATILALNLKESLSLSRLSTVAIKESGGDSGRRSGSLTIHDVDCGNKSLVVIVVVAVVGCLTTAAIKGSCCGSGSGSLYHT